MKKHSLCISVFFLSLCLGACQHKTFGVDESVWATLNEQEREKVIEGYNRQKEIELANLQKQKEKELENERHKREIEAQTAPIYAAADTISSIWGKSEKKKAKSSADSSILIQSISSKYGRKILTIEGTEFEVSLFCNVSAWLKGQKVELSSNNDNGLYPVIIKNLDNGERVNAKRVENAF